ncbi:MAG: PKD domain-containing protein [Thermoguttaceae bacterium]|jgi:murein DD-endopeptidase MepM/ murein hydrolase activator NlpD|nr:PKD domain-containing protein [Thermoguttaceae bacterium]
MNPLFLVFVAAASCGDSASGELPKPTIPVLERVVDLDVGQSQEVELSNGQHVTVKLLRLKESTDPIRDAVRQSRVEVEIEGHRAWIVSANYHLPVTVGPVQIDCPITKGPTRNSNGDAWGLAKDARLRLWPAGSPWIAPGTFGYPVKQRWFAASTQMANEPVYVDHGENPKVRKIYYHYGLDFGGCEGLTEVVAATDGLVVSSGKEVLEGYRDTPVSPRYDVVYVLDGRGWFCRYSHFHSIDPAIKPGVKVRLGQRLGLLGKEGGSGGWTHLHFDIFCRQPSGKWGCHESYAFAWEAYVREYRPHVIAVARPHHFIRSGDSVELDAGRSWSADGKIARYEWTFTDGTTAQGPRVRRTYAKPGYYSETIKVTDAAGHAAYDFAIVVVVDRQRPDEAPPSVHVTYHPSLGVRPGTEITFKARTFGTTDGEESWDFGDGSPRRTTRSDGNVKPLAKDGYVVLRHRYEKPGHYLVRVERTDRKGQTAVNAVHVEVEPTPLHSGEKTR